MVANRHRISRFELVSEIDPGLLEERQWALEERRFSSTRIQLTSVTDLGDSVASILEIGPGSGYFSSIMKSLNYSVKTADIKSRTNPDYLGDFREAQIPEKFDLVAAFEMLQHLPYTDLPATLTKLAELSNKYVLISIPSRVHRLELSIEVPAMLAPRRLGLGWLRGKHSFSATWEWPRGKDRAKETWEGREDYWKPHYWEVGRKSFPRSRFLADVESAGLRIIWHKYNPQHTHHLFVLAEKVAS
ncbi:methyltransferase domain-containing protein [Candidatus Lucifugimonas marina]|uniref:Methyltransferase domain-containing protein n=1 Tax=Candidatus Lucifugimonas marina TaxID=3038979 RepID=A0AAJ6CRX7_9CHLR|nr:methyltransferase domain-containing protein [SAR202 cluster bacterium JH702]MDG0868233.1 methyltransferase domain-containing protein [SAR202 cluster bacterium JH639]WFG34877.1 methyltransferase domain-containing protein [SAR202 cluster bacterium JH545]WFG38828.1 methyltransferase domain-containing protein [SAR202 cluster bacterium JH1073]